MRRLARLTLVLFGLGWTIGKTAFSYIDPNTGGMLFQLLAFFFAFFSAMILFFSRQVRMALARIGRLFRSGVKKE